MSTGLNINVKDSKIAKKMLEGPSEVYNIKYFIGRFSTYSLRIIYD